MESNQGSNSVLFALGELRDIEDDRLRTQEEREAELAAERKRLALEREEMDRQREEQRRFELELAERRASIEAQLKLEERRIALELERIPTPTLDAPARPKWPWLMSVGVLALAGMQFLMWQTQIGLDRSIAEVRNEQAKMTIPVIIAADEPEPTPPPAPAPTVVPTVEPTRKKSTRTSNRPPKPPKPPDVIPHCDPEDPLGCLPKQK